MTNTETCGATTTFEPAGAEEPATATCTLAPHGEDTDHYDQGNGIIWPVA